MTTNAVWTPKGSIRGLQGNTGQAGGSVTQTTAYALNGHRAVSPNDAGLVEYADCDDITLLSRPVWLTTDAWGDGVVATLVSDGPVTEPSWSWTPGVPIFLSEAGALSQTISPSAVFIRALAEVVSPTSILFRPAMPIVRG